MSDRVCIASSGNANAHISAEDLLSCCESCGMGYVSLSDSSFLAAFIYVCTCLLDYRYQSYCHFSVVPTLLWHCYM